MGGRPQSEALAKAARANYHAFDVAGDWDGRVEGLAIAARGMSMSVRAYELPMVVGDGIRICQVAELENPEGRWWLCNVHLAYQASAGEGRRRQLEAVLEILGPDSAGRPGVLLGDLNDVVGSEALVPLRDSRLMDAWNEAGTTRPFTFASANQWVWDDLWPDGRSTTSGRHPASEHDASAWHSTKADTSGQTTTRWWQSWKGCRLDLRRPLRASATMMIASISDGAIQALATVAAVFLGFGLSAYTERRAGAGARSSSSREATCDACRAVWCGRGLPYIVRGRR